MLGLSNGNSNASYEDIDFGLYETHGQIQVYESGTLKGTFGTYAAGDKLRVAVVGGVVKYSKNGTVFYTSTKTPTYPLLVDAALYTQGATLSNAVISGAPRHRRPATAERCRPGRVDLGDGRDGLPATRSPRPPRTPGATPAPSPRSRSPPATATSSSPPPRPTTYRMLGLSNGNSNASYEDIDFALYQYPGQIQVYESGTLKGSFGTYAAGDTLRVAVVGGVVKYSKNGVVFYTSTKAPDLPAPRGRRPLHPRRHAQQRRHLGDPVEARPPPTRPLRHSCRGRPCRPRQHPRLQVTGSDPQALVPWSGRQSGARP